MANNSKNNKIRIRLNTFGPYIKKQDIDDILNKKQKQPDQNWSIKILESFFERPISSINKDILNRYVEITTKKTHTNFSPAYKNIMERIVEPLVLSKRHYCLGEYISSIAVGGLTSEMLAHLVWKISTFKVSGKEISIDEEKKLFGKNFEKLQQIRRINILFVMKAIKHEELKKLDQIRTIRNKYLHAWEYDTKQQKGDAKKIVEFIFELFKTITDINLVLDSGKKQTLSINPHLLNFLNK